MKIPRVGPDKIVMAEMRRRSRYYEEGDDPSNPDGEPAVLALGIRFGAAGSAPTRFPWSQSIMGARCRAKKKGLPFNLTSEWAMARWTGNCELTGLPFDMRRGPVSTRPYAPSIDRIVPEKGYLRHNCRFIVMALNSMKMAGTDRDMLRIAMALVANAMKDIDGKKTCEEKVSTPSYDR